jgi:hypothetical protein
MKTDPLAPAIILQHWHWATPTSSGKKKNPNAPLDTTRSLCYEVGVVLSRIAVSLVVAMTLPVAAMPLSARTCILSNVASEKACKPGCCANKMCCETSEKNRTSPEQPLAKAGADQRDIVTLSSAIRVVEIDWIAGLESPLRSSAKCSSHSPATLALICIRLI